MGGVVITLGFFVLVGFLAHLRFKKQILKGSKNETTNVNNNLKS